MIKVTSNSISKNRNFSLKNFKRFFFEKERKKKFKFFEEVKLKSDFWKYDNKNKKNKKLLIISGLSRSGNHLLLSILDNHKDICLCGGEDGMLRNLLAVIKTYGEKKIERKIKSQNFNFIKKLSGSKIFNNKIILFDKWLKVSKLSKNSKLRHSGTQGINYTSILDFKNIKPAINYKAFENYLSKKIEIKNFFDFFYFYLEATRKLFFENKKKKFYYTLCHSGLRREINFLLSNNVDATILIPVRDFKGFYSSYLKGIYRTEKPNTHQLNDIWENWRHKVIDFLLLKEKFPNKIILIQYEDLIKNPKKLVNKLLERIKISKIKKLETTILGKPNYGNSSYTLTNIKAGSIYKRKNNLKLKDSQIPFEYKKIMKLIKKNKLK